MFTPFNPYGTNQLYPAHGGGRSATPNQLKPPRDPLEPPEKSLPRVVSYYADYSGCGFWRMIWPEHVLNAYQQVVIAGQTTMVLDPKYYEGIQCVRVQRQATPNQLKFLEHLKKISQELGFRIIYEVDDIVFREDIPVYNKFKVAFDADDVRESSQAIMELCDEMTVTCPFMREYYKGKTSQKNITAIPNYPPKFWLGHFYDEQKVRDIFRQYKTRPRILYAGSGAHFDVDNRVKQRDDFHHVSDAIIKSRNQFQWVFVGAFPKAVQPYIQSGQMEFHPWKPLYDYPGFMRSLNISMAVAPLEVSNFNNAKSDIKWVEACAMGFPIACQDMETYKNAPLKFTTGEEMIDIVSRLCGNKKQYIGASQAGWASVKERWLEHPTNYGKYKELFTLPYKHPNRKLLNALDE